MNLTEEYALATTGRSYEEIRGRGRDGITQSTLKHHRLLAYAWGKIDRLDERAVIDHRVELRWLNIEGNLEAVTHVENTRRGLRRADQRADDPEYCIEDTREVVTA